MLPKLPIRVIIAVTSIVLICVVLNLLCRSPYSRDKELVDLLEPPVKSISNTIQRDAYTHDQSIYQVQNETLGFQEVYMISLPSRTDKRDAFAMQAALSGITYRQIDGVDGREVPGKALPHTMDQSAPVVGCWRAHLNVLQKMVNEKVATALIFEDDADWDVSFKQQLVQFARGSRYISQTAENDVPKSPYGDNWDILWLGHCGTWVLAEDKHRFFVIPDDPTVEPPQYRCNVVSPDMSYWEGQDGDNTTRIVFNSGGAVCTAGYAVSQQGARKILYHMSMVPFNNAIDWGYAELCKDKRYNFNCVSVFPQLIGVSRPTGNSSKWSDIGYGDESTRTVRSAHSQYLVYSTRLNIANLLEGRTVFDSQYPTLPRLDISDIGSASGHVEVLDGGG
ncbi:hypothetical protein EDD36DRAFT_230957 [Exophiala viscosa]|uniref:Glycosyl transferase family 25 domain-containing protein n=1 Tax=Exophiala viscosa TaxID=2486360 RepID=A0AAN6IGH7_9EURO|nr:hypothetical protein EDD36DRAFT_230957 [Exophiala viscosa]